MQTDNEDNLAELAVSPWPILDAGPCMPYEEDYQRPPLPNLRKIIGDNP